MLAKPTARLTTLQEQWYNKNMKKLLEQWNRYLKDNRWKYHILNETAFSRIVTDYGKLGYIIITSERSCEGENNRECSEEEIADQDMLNKQTMDNLLSDLRSSGYGYLPVYGGFKESAVDPETGEEVSVDTDKPENSVIVALRKDVGNRSLSIANLKQFGIDMASKYNQDSFFYKPPNDIDSNAYFITQTGEIDGTFSDFTINDLNQVYYTQMKRGPKHRFTALSEMFFRVRTSPPSTSEARKRYGEHFMNFKRVL